MDRHIISSKATIIEALRRLNSLSGEVMTLFVVNDDKVMAGTVTDGDIRRALIAGTDVNDNVTKAMRKDFSALSVDKTDVASIRSMRRRGIALLPTLDSDGHIVSIADLTKTRSMLPMSAILMAGGIGERLRPLTLSTPKPLLKIDGKTIIDYNVESLAAVGINDITVATRYLSEQLHDHFSRPVAGVSVKCVTEEIPLGTIGAATLVDLPDEGNTIVMNSDLLTSIDFEEMYLRHSEQNAAITIASVPYVVSVPYAILATDGHNVTSIEEKPTYSHYANAGIYIINNRLLKGLRKGVRTDATTLIEDAVASGEKVTYFPINGTWIDVGSPADFRHAEELMRHHNNLKLKN